MMWLEEFQRKGEVELRFLEQSYIKGMSWQKIKPRGKTTGIKTAASDSHIEHISNYKGPTSRCKYLPNPPLKGKIKSNT